MPAVSHQREILTGELAAFRAVGSDGWGVGTLMVDGRAVALTGKLLGVRVGDSLEVEGDWHEHKSHGRQLRVRKCTSVQPQTAEGVVAWLASTLPQVSEARARDFVNKFGARLWEVLESRTDELATVPGITPERAAAICEAYALNRKDRDAMIVLRGWGLTDSQVGRCLQMWKSLDNVVEHIRVNPYQLSRAVSGFGFKRADDVAMRAGVPFDSPARIEAAIEHVLTEARGEGHCFLPTGMVARLTIKLIGAVDREHLITALRAVVNGDRAVRRGNRVYPRSIDTSEQRCADALRRLLRHA